MTMHGTGSPERDRVDEQLGLAREQIKKLAGTGPGTPTTHQIAIAQMRFQLHLGEALVRQIRDLDDDVWHLKSAVETAQADGQIIMNNIGSAIESLKPEGKRGLFG